LEPPRWPQDNVSKLSAQRRRQSPRLRTTPSTSIAPTGKRFAISMATIGHWKNGTMDHEWLFWDNQDFMKQIGLGK
jgi:hypothetical protein